MKRRDLLGLGGMTLLGAALPPAPVRAQNPKRGGTIALRLWDAPHFDPYLQVSYKTHTLYSFQTAEFPANVVSALFMRTDKTPFGDVRVRRAMSTAIDRTGIVNATLEGVGVMNHRRTLDPAKRREIIFDIRRYLAKQQYYVQLASSVYAAVWDRALRNYGPNLGFDFGGRLTAAWLDR